jgi:hypothetical protein
MPPNRVCTILLGPEWKSPAAARRTAPQRSQQTAHRRGIPQPSASTLLMLYGGSLDITAMTGVARPAIACATSNGTSKQQDSRHSHCYQRWGGCSGQNAVGPVLYVTQYFRPIDHWMLLNKGRKGPIAAGPPSADDSPLPRLVALNGYTRRLALWAPPSAVQPATGLFSGGLRSGPVK